MTPEQFDATYRAAPSAMCPGGVFMRAVVDDGELILEDRCADVARAQALATHHADQLRARVDDRQQTVYLFMYDGDTGECLQTVLFAPSDDLGITLEQ